MAKKRAVTFNASVREDLPIPLYHQIYMVLREKIHTGVYPEGCQIPSEHDIEKIFGVSRITAKRALDELAEEGLVSRQRGRGTIVTYTPAVGQAAAGIAGFFENMKNIALETEVRVLSFAYVVALPQAAAALHLEPNAVIQKAERVRMRDGSPFSHAVTCLPEDIGRTFSEADLSALPVLALIERAGIRISRARQSITATLADGTLAQALDVKIGAPLLKVTRVVFDADQRPVEFIIVHYRPEAYQLNMNLARVEGDDQNFWQSNQA